MNPYETNHAVWRLEDTCLCHVLTSLFPQQSSFANSPLASRFKSSNSEKSQLCVKFKRHNAILMNQHSVATIVNHNYSIWISCKLIMCHKRENHPNIYVSQQHGHNYHHEPPKTIACPTRKARSMLALARPVPATMVQWLRGVNPRLGLKKSP